MAAVGFLSCHLNGPLPCSKPYNHKLSASLNKAFPSFLLSFLPSFLPSFLVITDLLNWSQILSFNVIPAQWVYSRLVDIYIYTYTHIYIYIHVAITPTRRDVHKTWLPHQRLPRCVEKLMIFTECVPLGHV